MNRPPRRALRAFPIAGAIAAVCFAVGVGIAFADGEGEPIRLEYRAAPGCPDQSAFLARVRARTARARLAREGERARTFIVELFAGAHPAGSVTVMDGPRSGGARRLDADTCDDVADALALMVALALDPHALRAPSSPAPASLDAGAASASTPDLAPDLAPASVSPASVARARDFSALDSSALDSSAPDSFAPDSSTPDASVPDSSAPDSSFPSPSTLLNPPPPSEAILPSDAAKPPRPPPVFLRGSISALATDVTPRPLLAGAPYVGYRPKRPAFFGPFAPSLRLSFLRAGTGTLAATGGAADFTWTVGRLDGCAMLGPDRPLRVGACVRAEGGVLDVSGEQIVPAQTQHSGWLAAGAVARLEWSFFGPLFLDASGGPSVRILLNRFIFLPDTRVYELPVVGFFAEAGAGVHFL